jgi:hypothetical protein
MINYTEDSIIVKILLIEDSPAVQKAILGHLAELWPRDLYVVGAFNGKDGFKVMTTESFDLIITEFEPKDTFLGKITNSKVLSKKKIVVFSSHKPPMDLTQTPTIKYVDKSKGMHGLFEAIKSLITIL